MNLITIKSDTIGIISSTLCMIHCIVTPFLFIAQSCSEVCCKNAPSWWVLIDISFLIISLFALSYTVKNTSKKWVKYAMWTSWSFLLLVITNEQLDLFSIHKNVIYFPGLCLVVLHYYNLKYCRCSEHICCIAQK